MSKFPRVRTSFGFIVPVCPWCQAEMDGATVRLCDLVEAWEGEAPHWPHRKKDGQAGSPLVTDCPSCRHPSMIALASTGIEPTNRYVRLVPVRTATDARLLGGAE